MTGDFKYQHNSIANVMAKYIYRLIKCFCISLIIISCNLSTKKHDTALKKAELVLISLSYDSLPTNGFQLTMMDKNDSTQKFKLFTKEEDAKEPAVNLLDTITKLKYTVTEIYIDSLVDNNYTSKIICSDKTKEIQFSARPIDAIKIAKRFSAPVYIDKHLLTN
jgi:uncharacterized UBP type Zn finger protein